MATEKTVLVIEADAQGAIKVLQQVNGGLAGVGTTTTGVTSKTNILKSTWLKTSIVLAAAAIAIKKTVGVAAEFEQAIANVASVSGGAKEELSKLAREAGMNTVYTAKQAADALYFLASAGLKTKDMAQVLTPSLNLAAAGAIDIAEATDMVVNNLKVFGAEMQDAARYTDIMAKTVSSSNTDIRQLGSALKVVAPVAKTANVSFEDLNAVLATMANRGIKAERAGTQLRMAFARLIKPTSEAQTALAKYGITQEEISDMMDDPIALFQRLHDANMSQADALKILGVRQAGVFAMIKDGIPDLQAMKKAIEEAGGSAEAMALTQIDTLSGSMKLLSSVFQEVILDGTDGLLPMFKTMILATINIIKGFLKLPAPVKAAFFALTTGLGVALVAWKAFDTALKTNIIILAASAIATAAMLIISNWGRIKAYFINFWDETKAKWDMSIAAMKLSIMFLASVMIDAIYKMFKPFTESINGVIRAYNKLTRSNIATMEVIGSSLKKRVDANIKEYSRDLGKAILNYSEIVKAKKKQSEEIKAIKQETTDALSEIDNTALSDELIKLNESYFAKLEALGVFIEAENQLKSDLTALGYANDQTLLAEHLGIKEALEATSLAKRLKTQGMADKAKKVMDAAKTKAEQVEYEMRFNNFKSYLSYMSGAQSSNIKALWAIGKAANIAQIGMDSYKAAMAGYAAMAGIPVVGPVLGVAAAAAAIAFGAEQINKVAATPPPKAEKGGLIPGSPTGTLLTAGEKGKSEAIIPLEDSGVMEKFGGNHYHLHVENLYGGQDLPEETLKAIDEGLYKLKQDKSSRFSEDIETGVSV